MWCIFSSILLPPPTLHRVHVFSSESTITCWGLREAELILSHECFVLLLYLQVLYDEYPKIGSKRAEIRLVRYKKAKIWSIFLSYESSSSCTQQPVAPRWPAAKRVANKNYTTLPKTCTNNFTNDSNNCNTNMHRRAPKVITTCEPRRAVYYRRRICPVAPIYTVVETQSISVYKSNF